MSHRTIPINPLPSVNYAPAALRRARIDHYLHQTGAWAVVGVMTASLVATAANSVLGIVAFVASSVVGVMLGIRAARKKNDYEALLALRDYIDRHFAVVSTLPKRIERPRYTIEVDSLEFDDQLQLTITPLAGVYYEHRYVVTPISIKVARGPRLETLLPLLTQLAEAGDSMEESELDEQMRVTFSCMAISPASLVRLRAIRLEGD